MAIAGYTGWVSGAEDMLFLTLDTPVTIGSAGDVQVQLRATNPNGEAFVIEVESVDFLTYKDGAGYRFDQAGHALHDMDLDDLSDGVRLLDIDSGLIGTVDDGEITTASDPVPGTYVVIGSWGYGRKYLVVPDGSVYGVDDDPWGTLGWVTLRPEQADYVFSMPAVDTVPMPDYFTADGADMIVTIPDCIQALQNPGILDVWDVTTSAQHKLVSGPDAESGQWRVEAWNQIRFFDPTPDAVYRIVGIGTWYD